MTKKSYLFLISFITQNNISSIPTHVYVSNCTNLQFDVSINYTGETGTINNFWQKETDIIMPFDITEKKKLVLTIDRLLPKGEHLYTIKLINGTETINLKQKFISTSMQAKSEFGISLESVCLHDPWFMNKQAKERHEHLVSINGHTIIVVYYAYDNNENCEDIEYIFYEKISQSPEEAIHGKPPHKRTTYSMPIPISIPALKQQLPEKALPIIAQKLARIILSLKINRSTYHIRSTSTENSPQSSTRQSLSSATYTKDSMQLQKIFQHNITSNDQSVHHYSINEPSLQEISSHTPINQEMINYMAQKDSWYLLVDSQTTSQFWIPKNPVKI